MGWTQLHLVDVDGREVLPSIRAGVESAFGWTVRTYPNLDPAVLAEWAEEIGSAMQTNTNTHETPRRYAYAAMHGRVRDYLKTRASKELPEGSSAELEKWAGVDADTQTRIDRGILFQELNTKLDTRDQQILALLLQDITSASSVGKVLGISESAAAKAIQRLKLRIASFVGFSKMKGGEAGHGFQNLCETKG
jgi:hypothetical protein